MDTTSIRTPSSAVPAEKPKTAVCSGCGGKYPHRELIELHEDNHDNLTYFHGDVLVRSEALLSALAILEHLGGEAYGRADRWQIAGVLAAASGETPDVEAEAAPASQRRGFASAAVENAPTPGPGYP